MEGREDGWVGEGLSEGAILYMYGVEVHLEAVVRNGGRWEGGAGSHCTEDWMFYTEYSYTRYEYGGRYTRYGVSYAVGSTLCSYGVWWKGQTHMSLVPMYPYSERSQEYSVRILLLAPR